MHFDGAKTNDSLNNVFKASSYTKKSKSESAQSSILDLCAFNHSLKSILDTGETNPGNKRSYMMFEFLIQTPFHLSIGNQR